MDSNSLPPTGAAVPSCGTHRSGKSLGTQATSRPRKHWPQDQMAGRDHIRVFPDPFKPGLPSAAGGRSGGRRCRKPTCPSAGAPTFSLPSACSPPTSPRWRAPRHRWGCRHLALQGMEWSRPLVRALQGGRKARVGMPPSFLQSVE